MPLSDMSTEDLLAIQKGDLSKVSTQGLMHYQQMKQASGAVEQKASPQPFQAAENQSKETLSQKVMRQVDDQLSPENVGALAFNGMPGASGVMGSTGVAGLKDLIKGVPTMAAKGVSMAGKASGAMGSLRDLIGIPFAGVKNGLVELEKMGTRADSYLAGKAAPQAVSEVVENAAKDAAPEVAKKKFIDPFTKEVK